MGLQVFCFGFNGFGQLLQNCVERIITTPTSFSFPQLHCRNASVKTNVTPEIAQRDPERNCARCPCRNFGRDSLEDATSASSFSDRVQCAACAEKREEIVQSFSQNDDFNTTNILDCIDVSFSSTVISTNGGSVIGYLAGQNGACLDLSYMVENNPPSLKRLCIHQEDMFCIDDKGNCLVVDVKTATHQSSLISNKSECLSKGDKNSTKGKGYTGNKCWQRIETLEEETEAKSGETERCRFKRLAAGDLHVIGVVGPNDCPGRIFGAAARSYVFQPFPSLAGIKQVSCGKEHVLFLTHQGLVYSYGTGSRGQLGHGDTGREDTPRLIEALASVTIATISAGGWHSACVSDIGDLYIWGWNESGQLGFPSKSAQLRSSASKDLSSCLLVTFQMIPELLDLPGGVNVLKVSCGSRHTAAVTYDKRLYTWGWGKYGQLGHSTTQSVDSPKHVDFFHRNRLLVEAVRCGDWNTLVKTSLAPERL